MDRLQAMKVLLEAVDAGSLSAAGRRLAIPLATVSRRVSELEDYLKIQLLLRGSRKLVLTEAGRDYVASCRRILEDLTEVERNASGEYDRQRTNLAEPHPCAPDCSEVPFNLSAYQNADITERSCREPD
jgi:DNA-binding transcriptional LysR family regulator